MFRMKLHPSLVQVTEPASGCDINARRIQWCGKYSYLQREEKCGICN